MNYENPELLSLLAAEYVLGTMRGRARARFQRLLAESAAAREAVARWERELGTLIVDTAPLEPRRRVWRDIERRLFEPAPRERRWRALGLLTTLSTVVLAVFVALTPVYRAPTHFAQFTSDDANPLWVVSADLESGTLKARAVNVQAAELDRVFELWMLPESGPPRSLGFMPVGSAESRTELPAGLAAMLGNAPGLAISIEPPGGSPTGLPTGPVVYQASLVRM